MGHFSRCHWMMLWVVVVIVTLASVARANEFPGKPTPWNDYDRFDFVIDGRTCLVVIPHTTAKGKPWIWRARFFGHEPQADLALLSRGFHLVYCDVANLFGSPKAVAHWDAFYRYLTEKHGFARQVALEGMSRGGLIAYNWAAANPQKVACIYCDAPVCDFKSWPGGKGRSKGSDSAWRDCLLAYGLTEPEAIRYQHNPIDNLQPLALAKVPLLSVVGDADEVVPLEENTAIIQQRYEKLGGSIEVIVKKGVGHHPHSLRDPAPIVQFVLKHTGQDKSTARAGDEPHAGILITDLLIVGGTESGWASAIQAARMGVRSITLVNDIQWLGGQYTAEAVCALDENRGVDKQVPFPRSGLFKELTDRFEAFNLEKYGHRQPGNAWTANTTIRPAEAEAIFRQMLAPYIRSGQVRLISHYYPVSAALGADGKTLASVQFTSDRAGLQDFTVHPRMTIDASDWGDVIQTCGAAFQYGPDLKSKYHEPSAPVTRDRYPITDMNPITWCVVIEETDRMQQPVQPEHYDERRYFLTTSVTESDYRALQWPHRPHRPFNPPWVPSTGTFYQGDRSVYSQRRLVDHYSLKLKPGFRDVVLLNWSVQDYPLDVLPRHVIDALEKTEPGASKKNIVVMTRQQRKIIFDDARRHSLGMLHHLQTTVHDRMEDRAHSFRRFKLSDEFGTPDHLPPKPYIRESLRMEAMHMMREQDTRFSLGASPYAQAMYYDGVAAWQFPYDFHPTGRAFAPKADGSAAWEIYIKPGRSWSTKSRRSLFPLRSLIPIKVDGLLGAQKNLGYSSIVSSAVRLHDQSVAIGQASGATAALCLKHQIQPRTMPTSPARLAELRSALCSRLDGGQPLVLWPYRDLQPDDSAFVPANRLALRSIWISEDAKGDFLPQRKLNRRELARAVVRAALSTGRFENYQYPLHARERTFKDVELFDPDFAAIESLASWKLLSQRDRFDPDGVAKLGALRNLFAKLDWKLPDHQRDDAVDLTRGQFAEMLWQAIASESDHSFPTQDNKPFIGFSDTDRDGIADFEDALPFDRDNDSLPDLLDPDRDNDGLADDIELALRDAGRFNFTGKGSPLASGYQNDFGLKYDSQQGYGWREDISANHRRRGKHLDEAFDTFLFTRGLAQWELAVENGQYRVTVCVGDSGFPQPGQCVSVEGAVAAKDCDTASGEFAQLVVHVTVTDGRLTVKIGSENPKLNTCLNWLTLQRIE